MSVRNNLHERIIQLEVGQRVRLLPEEQVAEIYRIEKSAGRLFNWTHIRGNQASNDPHTQPGGGRSALGAGQRKVTVAELEAVLMGSPGQPIVVKPREAIRQAIREGIEQGKPQRFEDRS